MEQQEQSNTSLLASVIKNKFKQTTGKLAHSMMRFVTSQGNFIDLKESIDGLSSTFGVLHNGDEETQKKLESIDQHIIELGDMFKKLKFEPYTGDNTGAGVYQDPRYQTQDDNKTGKQSKIKQKLTIIEAIKKDIKNSSVKAGKKWFNAGVDNLDSPLLKAVVNKSIGYGKRWYDQEAENGDEGKLPKWLRPKKKDDEDDETEQPEQKPKKPKKGTPPTTQQGVNTGTPEQSPTLVPAPPQTTQISPEIAEQRTLTVSANNTATSILDKTEDHEDDLRVERQTQSFEKLQQDSVVYYENSSRLLQQIEQNTKNLAQGGNFEKQGIMDSALDMLDGVKRKGRNGIQTGGNKVANATTRAKDLARNAGGRVATTATNIGSKIAPMASSAGGTLTKLGGQTMARLAPMMAGAGGALSTLGTSASGALASAGTTASGLGSTAMGALGSISLPLLASAGGALLFGGTGLSSAYKAMKGEDASNWISDGLDSTLQKVTGDKDTSLGTMIYDMFHKNEPNLNEAVIKRSNAGSVGNTTNINTPNTSTTNNTEVNSTNFATNTTPAQPTMTATPTMVAMPTPDTQVDELERVVRINEEQSKKQEPIIVPAPPAPTVQPAPQAPRGQETVPIATRHTYNPLSSVANSMIGLSLRIV